MIIFKVKINHYYKDLNLKNQERFLKTKSDLAVERLSDFSLDFLEELKKMEPFGEGNHEPIFAISGVLLSIKGMGKDGQHLCLNVRDKDGNNLKLVRFYAPSEWFELELGQEYRILTRVAKNEWNGIVSTEGQIVDIML